MITAISMVRDEADLIEATVRHLFAEGVDRMIVADNLSTDGTRDILDMLAREFPLEVVEDSDPAYWQADKMTGLAQRVADGWVVPFDADEVWYSPGCTLRERLEGEAANIVTAVGFDHVRRHDDPDGHPYATICYRRPYAQRFPKVAFRAWPGAQLAQGNHSVQRPGPVVAGLELRHFQYRSFRQFVGKVRHGKAAYDLTTLPESEGAHWRQAGALTDQELADMWDRLCGEEGLVYDPAPVRCSLL